MKLGILSDLHLSFAGLPAPRNDASLFVLAGDIARPPEALAWASALAKPVLYVPGNHEFYGGTLSGTIAEMRQRCAGTQVRVLDNDEAVVDGVRFLGTTLWSDFRLFGDAGQRAQSIDDARRLIRDFSAIRIDDDSTFTPEHSARLFDVNAAWLERMLATPHAGPTVVITHHAPSRKSIHPRFERSLLNPCFVSDAERLLDGTRTGLWIHGHTHDSFDYVVNGTRVLCNPRGYAKNGVNENDRFDPDLVVEVQ